MPDSPCLRCDPFDGYPSLTNGKADAQIVCVDPALKAHPNLTLLTGAYVERLSTEPVGRRGDGRRDRVEGRGARLCGGYRHGRLRGVVVGAAVPALGQRARTPTGSPMAPGLVGRNYMRHNNATVLAISRTPNPTQFQKTLGLNDFYHGHALSPANDWEFPLGHIQMVGKSDGDADRAWRACRRRCIGCRNNPSTGSRATPSTSG